MYAKDKLTSTMHVLDMYCMKEPEEWLEDIERAKVFCLVEIGVDAVRVVAFLTILVFSNHAPLWHENLQTIQLKARTQRLSLSNNFHVASRT